VQEKLTLVVVLVNDIGGGGVGVGGGVVNVSRGDGIVGGVNDSEDELGVGGKGGSDKVGGGEVGGDEGVGGVVGGDGGYNRLWYG